MVQSAVLFVACSMNDANEDDQPFEFDEDDNVRILGPRLEGESYLAELNAEAEANKLIKQIAVLSDACVKRRAKDASDPRLVRAKAVGRKLEMELRGWLHAYLASWRPNRRRAN